MTFPRFIWENKTCSKAPIRMGLSENMASPKSSEIIIVFSLQLGDATHKLDPPIIEHVMASSVSEGGGLYLAKLAYFTNVSLGLCGISTYGVKVKLNQQRSLAGHHITHVLYIHIRRMPFTIWLVVLTILKNISQLGRIIPYIMENKKIGWNHQPAMIFEKHHHHWTKLNIYIYIYVPWFPHGRHPSYSHFNLQVWCFCICTTIVIPSGSLHSYGKSFFQKSSN